jgi:hypothetical protein
MDETRWFAASSPLHLLAHLRSLRTARTKIGRRKLRLFACACCRRLWPGLRESQKKLIEQAERLADGLCDRQAVMLALNEAYPFNLSSGARTVFSFVLGLFGARTPSPPAERTPPEPRVLRELLWRLTHNEIWTVVGAWRLAGGFELLSLRQTPVHEERLVQADLVRCLFGNPFRPLNFDPAWRTTTAVGLARGIYDENAFDRLPILADALEDAGCDDAEALKHCRVEVVHARGCHVVDALLRDR